MGSRQGWPDWTMRDINQIFGTLESGLFFVTFDLGVLKREFIRQELRQIDFIQSLTIFGTISAPRSRLRQIRRYGRELIDVEECFHRVRASHLEHAICFS